jgi:hypothetical protein
MTINETIQAFRQRAAGDYPLRAAYASMADAMEVCHFLSRVRLPGSGYVASLYSRLAKWRAARVEKRAQVCFERGWV